MRHHWHLPHVLLHQLHQEQTTRKSVNAGWNSNPDALDLDS